MDTYTDGYDDEERRTIIPTERMETYHTDLKTNLQKKLRTTEVILNENINWFETFPKSYQALESAENSLAKAYERYSIFANEYLFYQGHPYPRTWVK